jgi:hypothetical protein
MELVIMVPSGSGIGAALEKAGTDQGGDPGGEGEDGEAIGGGSWHGTPGWGETAVFLQTHEQPQS